MAKPAKKADKVARERATFHLPPDLLQFLRIAAVIERREQSAIVADALAAYLKKHPPRLPQ